MRLCSRAHNVVRCCAAGLEDQLLGKLILKEKHELEEQRQQLLEEVQSYKKKIKQLEDDLLFRCVLYSAFVGRIFGCSS